MITKELLGRFLADLLLDYLRFFFKVRLTVWLRHDESKIFFLTKFKFVNVDIVFDLYFKFVAIGVISSKVRNEKTLFSRP